MFVKQNADAGRMEGLLSRPGHKAVEVSPSYPQKLGVEALLDARKCLCKKHRAEVVVEILHAESLRLSEPARDPMNGTMDLQ